MDRKPKRIRHSLDPEKLEFTHIRGSPIRVGLWLPNCESSGNPEDGDLGGRAAGTGGAYLEGPAVNSYRTKTSSVAFTFLPVIRGDWFQAGQLSQLSALALLPTPA